MISENIYTFYSYFKYIFKYSFKYKSEEINSKNYVKTIAEKIRNNNENIMIYENYLYFYYLLYLKNYFSAFFAHEAQNLLMNYL